MPRGERGIVRGCDQRPAGRHRFQGEQPPVAARRGLNKEVGGGQQIAPVVERPGQGNAVFEVVIGNHPEQPLAERPIADDP
jgi:hypothetical protein